MMYLTRLLFIVFLVNFQTPAFGQAESIFPDLSGEELLQALVSAYKPVQTLPIAGARDTLYARIYRLPGDSLRCVYTGYTIYLDPNLDPSQGAFAENINLEHTYPQAMGADAGNASSDMHSLHPSRADVNNARGNLPFLEISDLQADTWFFMNQTFSSQPAGNLSAYSKVQNQQAFEPRDDHKGNIARAYFYFFTMYKNQALLANQDFFEIQRNTLCEWHAADPVDYQEYIRTHRIAGYQSNKPNPFVLDCTLAQRSYCPELDLLCEPVATAERPATDPLGVRVFPNPVESSWMLQTEVPGPGNIVVQLYHSSGQLANQLWSGDVAAGTRQWNFDRGSLQGGVWVVQVRWRDTTGKQAIGQQRLIVLPR